jgi:hypothetical protein
VIDVKRKIRWIALLLVFSLIIPVQTFAATTDDDTSLPKPGILLGNLFYGLDSLMEKVQVGLTFNPLMKADLLDKIAGERLAESEALVQKDKLELGQETLTKYQDTVNQMLGIVSKEILKGTDVTETINKIYDSSQSHNAVLKDIYAFLPAEQANTIQKNLDAVEYIKNANKLFATDEKTQTATDSEQTPVAVDKDTLNALLSMDNKKNAPSLDEILSNGAYNTDAINALYSLADNSGASVTDVVTKFVGSHPEYVEYFKKFGIDISKTLRYANMDSDDMLDWVFNFLESVDTDRMNDFLDRVHPLDEEE